ncbi:MAG: arsenate reductase family protein [Candidatus Fimenecus sp.]
MLFIEYPKCTTCQKAEKWLSDNGFVFTCRNIKTENPNFEELKAWHAQSGLPLKRFFNTSGLLYKSMQLKEKLPAMSEEEQLRLLATDGMLVKRPLLITDSGAVLTGFREKEWVETLKNE